MFHRRSTTRARDLMVSHRERTSRRLHAEHHRGQLLLTALDTMDQVSNPMKAAKDIFSEKGLHPQWWGINRTQLIAFRGELVEAMARGDIKGQPDKTKPFHYSKDKFDDAEIGPNMHHVNEGLIKPLTLDGTSDKPAFMPGLSYALMRNYATGGLLCELFFSHAWDEVTAPVMTPDDA